MLINPYSFAPPGPSDPHFANVSLLLHFDALVSGSFPDTSSNALPMTGSPTLDTTDQQFGAGCGEFASVAGGTSFGNILTRTIAASDPLDLSTGAYTVEGWFLNRSSAATVYFGTDYLNHLMLIPTAGSLVTTVENTTLPGGTVSVGSREHIAVVMDGSDNATVYINGTATGSPTHVTRAAWAGDHFHIGGTQFGPSLAGIVDEFRVTKGVARYTSNFTPPVAAFLDH